MARVKGSNNLTVIIEQIDIPIIIINELYLFYINK